MAYNMTKPTKTFNEIKWSPILHGIAAVSGVVGALALLSWWILLLATEGFSLFLSPEHAYNDAVILFLASIAFGIGALVHQNKERK